MKTRPFTLLFAFLLASQTIMADPSTKTLFDRNWLFHLGDVAGVEKPGFKDVDWRKVCLPHDWSVETSPHRDAPAGNDGGYRDTGKGWYRKYFKLSAKDMQAARRWLYFEGVYERSIVYVNGQKAGGWPYGYSSFYVDITEYVHEGDNVVAVSVDNSQQKNCRWYSGSGIYRHVWMLTAGEQHIANWGVQITTPDLHTVKINTSLYNVAKAPANVQLRITVDGQTVSKAITLDSQKEQTVEQTIHVANPKTWSPEHPNLYTAVIEIVANRKVLDRKEQTFGIRTISYSAETGLLLNGEPIKLNGGCLHHDNGILGAAAFDRAEDRKAEMMKAAGFNAARTSHNVPSEAFLDACDRIGLLVIDEAFDGWRKAKNKFDYSTLFDEWYAKDIEAMVRRDRNHPSIFCWSIGNEVIERKSIEIVTTARKLKKEVRRWDDTRPVTSALAAWDKDWEIYDPLAETLDIVGYNYMIHKAASDHDREPERVMMQTESYPKDAFSNWAGTVGNSYRIGDFVWTSIDYLGESGIGRYWYESDVPGEHYNRPLWPWNAAYCGDIDLTGWRKPISHYRAMLWNGTDEKLYMAVKEPDGYFGKGIKTGKWAVWPTWESWTWPGWEGKDIEVEIYSRHEKVRLYLNDELICEKPTSMQEEFKAVFKIPYEAGTLRVEGIDNDNVLESKILKTAGEPNGIRLTADRTNIKADNEDLSFITVELTDKDGNISPNADNLLTFRLSGSATLQAVGNACISDTTSYMTNVRRAYKGRAMAVVRAGEKKGTATLTVSAKGIKSKTVKIKIN